MTNRIREINIADMGDDELRPVVEFFNTLSREAQPRHTDMSIEELRIFDGFPGSVKTRHLLESDAGQVLGVLRTSYADDGSNPDKIRVDIGISPKHRRKGLGTRLLEQALEISAAANRTTLTSSIYDTVAASEAFARATGARRVMDMHLNVLKTADLDRQLLESWASDGPTRAPGYDVEIYENTFPDELAEGLAHLYLVLERDMPTPEGHEPRTWTPEIVLQFRDQFIQGTDSLMAIAFHSETGAAAGMSQLIRRHTNPSTWIVTTTMVDPEHRGHALGKWTKAAVNLRALKDWPEGEWQETGNAFTNDAMLGINHAMGFTHEFTATEVELSLEHASAFVQART